MLNYIYVGDDDEVIEVWNREDGWKVDDYRSDVALMCKNQLEVSFNRKYEEGDC